ncbi:MAG: hypothetical protein HQL93_13565, partial [Magnetococcales bacterium]|nr:hypothetical protein [Magnetococcales bacterium]
MIKPSLRIMVVCVVGLTLTACGGGGSGSSGSKTKSTASPSVSTYYGIFQGSIVSGVHYKAELNGQTVEGETDVEGKFQFVSDGTSISPVVFSVGGVTLGSVTPDATGSSFVMSVYDLVKPSDADANAKAINIQRFLHTINSSSNANVILVDSPVRTALAGERVKLNETPVAEFDTKANGLLSTLVNANSRPVGITLVSAATVTSHIQETKSQIDAKRVGTFEVTTGADSVLADGKTRVLIRALAKNMDGKPLVGGLVHFETTAGSLGNETNLCDSSTQATKSVDQVTDLNGMAFVMLTPRCQTANALVSVSFGGKVALKTIQLIPDPGIVVQSGMTTNPKLVGVHYRAELNGQFQEGETDSDGRFRFLSDGINLSLVNFAVGGVSLGTVLPNLVAGAYVVNGENLVKNTDSDARTKTINVQRFLSTISTSTDASLILINANVATALAGAQVKLNEISVADFDTTANTLLATLIRAGARPVGTTLATSAMVTASTNYGFFKGPIVEGVHYSAELNGLIKSGETDAEGRFPILSDGNTIGSVTFSVGGVTLGSVAPASIVGPYHIDVFDLVSGNDSDGFIKAINIQRFLKTIQSSINANLIQVSKIVRDNLAGEILKLNEAQVTIFDAGSDRLKRLNGAIGRPLDAPFATVAEVLPSLQDGKTQIDAMRVGSFEITTGADSVLADGKTRVLVRVQAKTVAGKALEKGLVHFETTAGELLGSDGRSDKQMDKLTDATGMASLLLVPGTQTAQAVISVSMGGKVGLKTVQFTPSQATDAQFYVNPQTLPADGVSSATVVVSLSDVNGFPVADNTPVTLLINGAVDASVKGTSSVTLSGRATFTITAGFVQGEAKLSLREYGDKFQKIVKIGELSSGGNPVSLRISSNLDRVSVKGVGKSENATITIQAVDGTGKLLNESMLGYGATLNNLKVTLKTRPQGGETISGVGYKNGSLVTQTSADSLDLRTTNGEATLTLTSGTRPGIVELLVEALDGSGVSFVPPVTAISPLIAVSSGPVHTISLTEAYQDGVVNMNVYGKSGVYCRLGSALVTDRYGNAVPNGTMISLSLLDAVLASGTNGKIAGDLLTDSSLDFSKVALDQSGTPRKIQPGDQVVIEKNVNAQDRRR